MSQSNEHTRTFDQLVDQAAEHAKAQDEAYAAPQAARRRRTAQIGLAVCLPILALVVFWNLGVSARVLLPPPHVETVDLARTLVVTAAEIDDFVDRTGRLPVGVELSPILPARGRLTATDTGYELTVDAPLVGTLRLRGEDDPDRWLDAVRAAVQPREES